MNFFRTELILDSEIYCFLAGRSANGKSVAAVYLRLFDQ